MSKKSPKIKFKSPELCFIYGYYHMDSNLYNTEERTPFTNVCEEVIDKYIGKVLGIDFNEFYNDEKITSFNKIEAVKAKVSEEFGNWFIGDTLTDVVYNACFDHYINETNIVKELKHRYEWFMNLYSKNKLMRKIQDLEVELALLNEQLQECEG